MANFKYKALKDNKIIINGEVDAVDYKEARAKISNLGFLPTEIYSEDVKIKNEFNKKFEVKDIFLSLKEKIAFTTEIQTFLSSGIPILEALHQIKLNTPYEKLRNISTDMISVIESGMTFSQAIESIYPKTFGNIYLSLVKTGEESGELEKTLDRMVNLLHKQDNIKGKIIQASIYPCILILMIFGLLVLFSVKVIPAFLGILTFNGTEMPMMMKMLMGLCDFTTKFWWLIIIGVGAFFGLLMSSFENVKIKNFLDKMIMKIPVISDFVEYINLSNFIAVLDVSYDAGVPLIAGLELARKTVSNSLIKDRISNSIFFAKQGNSLAMSFKMSKAMPYAFITMLSAGEESGSLGKMFHDISDVIDKKIDIVLNTMARLFEPTIIIILGGVVLFIALAFYQTYIASLMQLF